MCKKLGFVLGNMAIIRLPHSADSCVELCQKSVDILIRNVGVCRLLEFSDIFFQVIN